MAKLKESQTTIAKNNERELLLAKKDEIIRNKNFEIDELNSKLRELSQKVLITEEKITAIQNLNSIHSNIVGIEESTLNEIQNVQITTDSHIYNDPV